MKVQSWTPRIYAPLLLGHLGVLLFVGERWTLVSSYGFVLAMMAFTVLLCCRRLQLSVSHNTPLWGLLLGALLAQFAAFALLLVDALHHPRGTLVALDPTFYFCLGSFWLIAAAAYNPLTPMRRWTTAIDGVLACAIVALFYLMLVRLLAAGHPVQATGGYVMSMFDGMGLFVALFATLRFVATRRADERRFQVPQRHLRPPRRGRLPVAGRPHAAPGGRMQPGVVAARYGGEELVILLSDLDIDRAEAVVQRLRQRVEALQVRHINSAHGAVTISAGVAVMAAGTSLASEKLLRVADEALFAAKREGRNQVRRAATLAPPAKA